MYDAVTRNTYAELFKLAEANLPASVRAETVKIASANGEELLAGVLTGAWRPPK